MLGPPHLRVGLSCFLGSVGITLDSHGFGWNMRLEITRRTDLAVRALQVLGASGDRMKAPAIAEAIGSTPSFVPHVLTPLVKAGWVRSEPGRAGGYSLTSGLDELSLLRVLEAIEGPTNTGHCVLVDGPCDEANKCAIHTPWQQARTGLTDALDAVMISDASVGCGE